MFKKKEVNVILSIDENGCIGKDGKLAVSNSMDMKFFKTMTTNSYVIMGSNTYESLPKALSDRTNIIISRNPYYMPRPNDEVKIFDDIKTAIKYANNDNKYDTIFIIGGASIYNQVLSVSGQRLYGVNNIYVTRYNTTVQDGTAFIRSDIINHDFYRSVRTFIGEISPTYKDSEEVYGKIYKYNGNMVLLVKSDNDESKHIKLDTDVDNEFKYNISIDIVDNNLLDIIDYHYNNADIDIDHTKSDVEQCYRDLSSVLLTLSDNHLSLCKLLECAKCNYLLFDSSATNDIVEIHFAGKKPYLKMILANHKFSTDIYRKLQDIDNLIIQIMS